MSWNCTSCALIVLSLQCNVVLLVFAVPQIFKLQLPSGVVGPDSFAFDARGRPYTGVADGRILRLEGPILNFTEFATTSPSRTRALCDGTKDIRLLSVCGRPLGLGFYYQTGDLYITDAALGLLVVERGGLATQISGGVDGKPFGLADALDIDQATGTVYFVDAGTIFKQSRNFSERILTGDTTGMLLKYEPRNKQVTVLLSGLSGPTGVALSAGGSYLLITESIAKRIQRFWLRGPRANTAEILTTLEGSPDNIKRTVLGDFWVAVNNVKRPPSRRPSTLAQRIIVLGTVVASVDLTDVYGTSGISEVQEFLGGLYIGSLQENFVGVYII